MKRLSFKRRNGSRHWVGDGFPVRSAFSYDDSAEQLSPFLLLDHAGPATFDATTRRRGVGQHPHRGFETVTIVYDGEVEHRDSAGGGGSIGPGDVQWMTAGAGIIHEEYHGTEYARRGGPFEMIQLWVNLPARDKMTAPGYQGITSAQIPRVDLPDGAGTVRVIAGRFGGQEGPARTFSPVDLWDVRVRGGSRAEFKVPDGHTTALFVLHGTTRVGDDTVADGELAVLEREGDTFAVEAIEDVTLLVLSGKPLNEPVVGYGPFVMTSQEEIAQALADFQAGRMGRMSTPGAGEA